MLYWAPTKPSAPLVIVLFKPPLNKDVPKPVKDLIPNLANVADGINSIAP